MVTLKGRTKMSRFLESNDMSTGLGKMFQIPARLFGGYMGLQDKDLRHPFGAIGMIVRDVFVRTGCAQKSMVQGGYALAW